MKDRFLEDIKTHKMTVELDHDPFRSLLFKKPKSSEFHFRIITWPGHLAISGDMGDYVFAATPDMFSFFRGDELTINVYYWAQKLVSISRFGGNNGSVIEFDPTGTITNINNEPNVPELEYYSSKEELLEAIEECTSSEEALEVFRKAGLDALDQHWNLVEYRPTFHSQWVLYAIRWGIQQYDKVKCLEEQTQ